jgi:putative spermidine/putrescine transport system substrate-binding protein
MGFIPFLLRLMLLLLPCAAMAAETLRVLAWPGYADPDLVKGFEQKYSVHVEVSYISTDDELWARLGPRQGGDFDVFAANTAELQRYIDRGISVPLDVSHIPNTARQLPRFRILSEIPGLVRDGAVYAIPYTYSEMGLIYDRKQFASPPDSIAELWNPRYKGKVLAFQGSTHNFTIAAQALGLKNPFQITDADFKRVSRHLVALRRNVLSFYNTPEEATDLFMKNHAALMFGNYGSQQVTQLLKAGADIGYVIPKEGALAWLDCWSVTRGAGNKALAEAWINYMLEAKVSNALSQRQGLSNTVEPSRWTHGRDKIIWLEKVESASKRALLWNRILSGDVMERF